jgi:K+-transporting ATPase ATPase A chain
VSRSDGCYSLLSSLAFPEVLVVNLSSIVLYAIFLGLVTLLVRPVGAYMARVFSGEATFLDRGLKPVERVIYRVARIDPESEMSWSKYALSFVEFTVLLAIVLYVVLQMQSHLPWFYADRMTTPMTQGLLLNTAISFATTTTWQAYGGETTMSYVSQMTLAMANFLAAAAGLAVGIAFIRGFARQHSSSLGNFWVDLVRGTLWILLPVALVGSLILVWQGVPANLHAYAEVNTVEGGSQVIAQGPVAVLEFIKNLGTNGGGFFNVNGAHPFANPTALTNVVGMLAIVVLPASLTYTFGRMTRRQREGWLLYGVMALLFVVGLAITGRAEQSGNALIASAGGLETQATANQSGGNMEGKETRFGIGGSVLTAIATSNGSTGSFNSMHDSYTPLGNVAPMVNMLIGDISFGGLGSGLYGMIIILLLTLFFAGLMVGRTPEYLGKRLGPDETKRVMLYAITFPAVVLFLSALAAITGAGKAGPTVNSGAHAFTQIVFAYASSAANNGLTMASLNANSNFYNITTALAMLAGRLLLGVFALVLAGQFASQTRRAPGAATLPTASLSFAGILIGVIAIFGGLSYFVVVALGPLAEQIGSGV